MRRDLEEKASALLDGFFIVAMAAALAATAKIVWLMVQFVLLG